jgi:hypothetical protein
MGCLPLTLLLPSFDASLAPCQLNGAKARRARAARAVLTRLCADAPRPAGPALGSGRQRSHMLGLEIMPRPRIGRTLRVLDPAPPRV